MPGVSPKLSDFRWGQELAVLSQINPKLHNLSPASRTPHLTPTPLCLLCCLPCLALQRQHVLWLAALIYHSASHQPTPGRPLLRHSPSQGWFLHLVFPDPAGGIGDGHADTPLFWRSPRRKGGRGDKLMASMRLPHYDRKMDRGLQGGVNCIRLLRGDSHGTAWTQNTLGQSVEVIPRTQRSSQVFEITEWGGIVITKFGIQNGNRWTEMTGLG